MSKKKEENSLPIAAGEDVSLVQQLQLLRAMLWRARFSLGISVVLCLAVAFVLHRFSKPYWTAQLTAYSIHLPNKRAASIVDQLDDLLIGEENKMKAARLMKLPLETVEKIKGLNGRSNAELDGDRIYTAAEELARGPIAIEATVYDMDILPEVTQGLRNYFQQNPFVAQMTQYDTVSFHRNIVAIRKELAYLDSTQRALEALLKGSTARQMPMLMTDLANISGQKWNLQKDLEYQLNTLDMNRNDLRIMEPFVARVKPTGPKLTVFLLVGLLAGLVLGLVLAGQGKPKR